MTNRRPSASEQQALPQRTSTHSQKHRAAGQEDAQERGRGYLHTPLRIEWRPTYRLGSRDELSRALDVFAEAGVRAWWYAAASKGAYPLFPSKHLPHRADADADLFRWLTEAAHQRGISIFSWQYLSTSPMTLARHPEWRIRPIGGGEAHAPDEPARHICHHSPYGELLKQYCVEIVDELGFDGIWFDGAGLHLPGGRIGCACTACAHRFAEDTGLAIPERVELADATFRRFVQWRYAAFMTYWRELADHVYAHAPSAVLIFNHFNRLNNAGWASGCPLARHGATATAAAESDGQQLQLPLQHKLLRAINDDHQPTEVWAPLLDGAGRYYPQRPEPDSRAAVSHIQVSAAAGGFASFGIGDDPADYRQALRSMVNAAETAAPYVGGRLEASVGLLVSQASLDFSGRPAFEVWQSIHGMHWLLQSLHWPNEPLLDEDLNLDRMRRYSLVVLPATDCLSATQVAAIGDYLDCGGVVLAVGACGTHNADGQASDAFDDLAGIQSRHDGDGEIILTATPPTWQTAGLPQQFMLAGTGRLWDVAAPTETLATASTTIETQARRYGPEGLIAPTVQRQPGAAIIMRRVGQGRIICVASDMGQAYAQNNHGRSRTLSQLLAGDALDLPFRIDAPPTVHVEPWRQADRLSVHLTNTPPILTHLRVASEFEERPYWPEDLPPTGPITITGPAGHTHAKVVLPSDADPEYARESDRITVRLDHIHDHAVVVFQRSRDGR